MVDRDPTEASTKWASVNTLSLTHLLNPKEHKGVLPFLHQELKGRGNLKQLPLNMKKLDPCQNPHKQPVCHLAGTASREKWNWVPPLVAEGASSRRTQWNTRRDARVDSSRRFLRSRGWHRPCKPAERMCHPMKGCWQLSDQHMPSPCGDPIHLVRTLLVSEELTGGALPGHAYTTSILNTDKSYFVRLSLLVLGIWWGYLEYQHTQPVGTQSQNSQWNGKLQSDEFSRIHEVTGPRPPDWILGRDQILFWSWGNLQPQSFCTARAHVCLHLQKHLEYLQMF